MSLVNVGYNTIRNEMSLMRYHYYNNDLIISPAEIAGFLYLHEGKLSWTRKLNIQGSF